MRPVNALHIDAFSILLILKPPLLLLLRALSLFSFLTNCSPSSSPLRAEIDKVCEQWNAFERRQAVTMDLLCVYPEATSILSGCVYYCWSPLESIWVVGFGHSDPCQEQYSFLLWHGYSAGIASLLRSRVLAPHPDQLRDTVKKIWSHVRAITLLILMIKLFQSDPWRELALLKPRRQLLTFLPSSCQNWLVDSLCFANRVTITVKSQVRWLMSTGISKAARPSSFSFLPISSPVHLTNQQLDIRLTLNIEPIILASQALYFTTCLSGVHGTVERAVLYI